MNRAGAFERRRQQMRDRLRRAGEAGLRPPASELPPGLTPADEQALLESLWQRGEAVEEDGLWRTPEAAGFTVGHLMLRDDEHRVRVDRGDDLVVAPDDLAEALEGDTVLVRPLPEGRRRSGQSGLRRGRIEEILDSPYDRLVGRLESDGSGRRLLPFDFKLALEPAVPDADDGLVDHWVEAALVDAGTAQVERDLGAAEAPGTATAVVIAQFEIPEFFPAEVEAAAEGLGTEPRREDLAGREDLRDLCTFTIDGESTRDFDDALSLEYAADGWRLGVHIADVAHYVPEGGVLDREAYRRGTSVYFPGRVVPMLPAALSDGLCSLRPEVDRLTRTVFLTLDSGGRVRRAEVRRSVIRSRHRLTYRQVTAALEGREELPANLLAVLRSLREVTEGLQRRRAERGSLDFDLPSSELRLDAAGETVDVTAGERTVAHRMIEEAMVAANEAVARYLRDQGVAGLYRTHEAPLRENLEDLRAVLENLGIPFPQEAPGSLDFAELLAAVAGTQREDFISTLVRRALPQAAYRREHGGHFALASTAYTHFTSPIRRYPDLEVHRTLDRIEGRAGGEGEEPAERAERLIFVADHCTAMERRAAMAERTLSQWKRVRFLADRTGERFSGRITGVQPFGLFIELDRYQVSGLAPISALGKDYFRFEPEGHRMVGAERGKSFQLGASIEVELTDIDPRRRGLLLAVREPERRRSGRRDRR
ncbi:MAG: VacB/RNase II family 3'-5' exoribonuclease [Acidobacteriota bacterium]